MHKPAFNLLDCGGNCATMWSFCCIITSCILKEVWKLWNKVALIKWTKFVYFLKKKWVLSARAKLTITLLNCHGCLSGHCCNVNPVNCVQHNSNCKICYCKFTTWKMTHFTNLAVCSDSVFFWSKGGGQFIPSGRWSCLIANWLNGLWKDWARLQASATSPHSA